MTDHIVLWRVLSFHGVASNSLFPLLSHLFRVLPTSNDLLTLFVRPFELLRQSTMWIPLINYNTAFHPFFCWVPTTLLPYNSTPYTLTNSIHPFNTRFNFFKSVLFPPIPAKYILRFWASPLQRKHLNPPISLCFLARLSFLKTIFRKNITLTSHFLSIAK